MIVLPSGKSIPVIPRSFWSCNINFFNRRRVFLDTVQSLECNPGRVRLCVFKNLKRFRPTETEFRAPYIEQNAAYDAVFVGMTIKLDPPFLGLAQFDQRRRKILD